jgi:hypothetical protein
MLCFAESDARDLKKLAKRLEIEFNTVRKKLRRQPR